MLIGESNMLIGTSGWSYDDWIGPFYNENIKSMLRYYSKIFRTAEINSTFYSYPDRSTVLGWLRYTSDDFVFTAKIPQLVTHEKRINVDKGVEEDLKRFIELMEPLIQANRLGCLLIQLPPKFKFNIDRLESFLAILPDYVRFAVEFRDLSWLRSETFKLLEKYGVAYTIVDEPLLPPEVHVTADFACIRWHGRGKKPWYNYRYSEEELGEWIPKIREVASQVNVVYGYFNNHYHEYSIENCLIVLEMLGIITPEQMKAWIRLGATLSLLVSLLKLRKLHLKQISR
ncbi:MAG: DUF72 domain-containing protein [archaeon GB-1867-035]|nr:DUF72 domain-containing protein [Candidatus Culexmicrobium profundum]